MITPYLGRQVVRKGYRTRLISIRRPIFISTNGLPRLLIVLSKVLKRYIRERRPLLYSGYKKKYLYIWKGNGQRRKTVDLKSKTDIIKEYQHHATDSGSTDVQVAVLTHRISELTDHLQTHRHDHATRRGLLMLVGRRRRLLRYLRRKDSARYKEVVSSLGLRA